MANNRLLLVCERCAANPDVPLKDHIFWLAKYDPLWGWTTLENDEKVGSTLTTFFSAHRHGDMWGEWMRTMYENEVSPRGLSKRALFSSLKPHGKDSTE